MSEYISIYDQYMHNYRDVRIWLTLLRDAERDGKPMDNDKYIEIKRAIRKFYHKVCEKAKEDTAVISGDFDCYTRRYPLPECIKTKEEAVEYMEEYEVMECAPSQYDCTGQHFTSWYKVFCRNGRWQVYHHICVDV